MVRYRFIRYQLAEFITIILKSRERDKFEAHGCTFGRGEGLDVVTRYPASADDAPTDGAVVVT